MKTSGEIRRVGSGQDEIRYLLLRKAVKNVNLRVKSDATVVVSANQRVSAQKIDDFVFSKREAILNALRKFEELQRQSQRAEQYIDGETVRLLGRELRLSVVEDPDERIEVEDGALLLFVKNKDDYVRKEKLARRWRDEQCRMVFERISRKIYQRLKDRGVPYPRLVLRDMKSRWGSCQPEKAVVTLNKKLIDAPERCIEYVVLHEYAHFIEPNHSKRFYAVIQPLMPDWKEQKKLLESGYHCRY